MSETIETVHEVVPEAISTGVIEPVLAEVTVTEVVPLPVVQPTFVPLGGTTADALKQLVVILDGTDRSSCTKTRALWAYYDNWKSQHKEVLNNA